MAKRRNPWLREPLIFVLAMLFGLLAVPAGIFFVGNQVFGAYANEGSLQDLTLAIWADLGARKAPAWALVASPYAVLMLLRLCLASWRRPRRRVAVGESH